MNEADQHKAARKRAHDLAKLYKHLMVYGAVIFVLAVIDAISDPGEWWVHWVALVWGFVILKRTLRTFGAKALFDKGWEERKTAELMGEKPKRKNAEDYFEEGALE